MGRCPSRAQGHPHASPPQGRRGPSCGASLALATPALRHVAGVLTHSRVNQVGRAQPASWNEVPTRAGRASSGRSSLDRAEHDNARSRPLEMGRRGHWIDARIHRHNAVRPATCRFQKCGGFLKTSIWKPRRLFVRSDYRPMYSLMYSRALGTICRDHVASVMHCARVVCCAPAGASTSSRRRRGD